MCGFSESHTRLSVRICGHLMMPVDVFADSIQVLLLSDQNKVLNTMPYITSAEIQLTCMSCKFCIVHVMDQ